MQHLIKEIKPQQQQQQQQQLAPQQVMQQQASKHFDRAKEQTKNENSRLDEQLGNLMGKMIWAIDSSIIRFEKL